MQLRHLQSYYLYSVTKVKQTNGAYIDTKTLIKSYYCSSQELTDEVSASIYGATLDKMIRISSVRSELEDYLKEHILEVSDYLIVFSTKKYKIVSVKNHWVDIELIGSDGQISA